MRSSWLTTASPPPAASSGSAPPAPPAAWSTPAGGGGAAAASGVGDVPASACSSRSSLVPESLSASFSVRAAAAAAALAPPLAPLPPTPKTSISTASMERLAERLPGAKSSSLTCTTPSLMWSRCSSANACASMAERPTTSRSSRSSAVPSSMSSKIVDHRSVAGMCSSWRKSIASASRGLSAYASATRAARGRHPVSARRVLLCTSSWRLSLWRASTRPARSAGAHGVTPVPCCMVAPVV